MIIENITEYFKVVPMLVKKLQYGVQIIYFN